MAQHRPWGINSISSMIGTRNAEVHVGTRWFRAVPAPYHTFGVERLRAAWWVLTGRAHAVVWPEAGDLEKALDP